MLVHQVLINLLDRIAVFSQIYCASLLTSFLTIPAGAALMSLSPWVPMFVSSAMTLVSFLVVFCFVTETLPQPGDGDRTRKRIQRNEAGDDSSCATIFDWVRRAVAVPVSVAKWVAHNARVAVVLLAFFFLDFAQPVLGPLLIQYASKRLGWSLAKVELSLSWRLLLLSEEMQI